MVKRGKNWTRVILIFKSVSSYISKIALKGKIEPKPLKGISLIWLIRTFKSGFY